MILVRSPLRITLGGGGTDLPSYSSQFGGFCLSAALDKYVYVAVTRPFYPGIYLKYSELERCETPAQIQHPIMRAALKGQPQIEITTLADIPAGTGLGSSSSFTTALLQALAAYEHQHLTHERLAQRACEIEITELQQPIGKQDQYIAAYGGLCAFTFKPDGSVHVYKPALSHAARTHLEDHLLLFFTGHRRATIDILRDQNERTKLSDTAMLDNLHATKHIGEQTFAALQREDFVGFGHWLHQQWILKEKRSPGIIPQAIVDLYNVGWRTGAQGKLVGAGGGGFLLFYTEEPRRLRAAMNTEGLEELRFHFDYEGTKVLLS